MIVDGALNCAYDVFQSTNEEYLKFFPSTDQDIQFEDELSEEAKELLPELWKRPVRRSDAQGIHGIIFYELPEKKEFYPNRKDTDLDGIHRAVDLYT